MQVDKSTDEVEKALYKMRESQSEEDLKDLRHKLKKLKVCLKQANKLEYNENQHELKRAIGQVLRQLEYK